MVTPSDALVINTAEFARCIAAALEKTAESAAIVTLGIKPSRPETGYGYIAAKGEADSRGIYEMEAFKEKPDKETALKYVAAGNFSGMRAYSYGTWKPLPGPSGCMHRR